MVENNNVITQKETTKKSSLIEKAFAIYVAADFFLKMDLTQSIFNLIKSLINQL